METWTYSLLTVTNRGSVLTMMLEAAGLEPLRASLDARTHRSPIFAGPADAVLVLMCGIYAAIDGGQLADAVNQAASSNGCLRIRAMWFAGYSFSNDHSKYCKP